jgi:hypothetical protein
MIFPDASCISARLIADRHVFRRAGQWQPQSQQALTRQGLLTLTHAVTTLSGSNINFNSEFDDLRGWDVEVSGGSLGVTLNEAQAQNCYANIAVVTALK